MSFTVAIIGRPNVGKSTLFNRLAGRRLAIVHDMPGVTRDRRAAKATLAGLEFTVIDTAGLEDADDDSLEGRMRQQAEAALREADVALFLIDARAGVTPVDEHFADLLRRQDTPVIVAANKCEGRAGESGLYEAYALGLGEPVPISAEHGEGMGNLFEALRPFAPPEADTFAAAQDAAAAPVEPPLSQVESQVDGVAVLDTGTRAEGGVPAAEPMEEEAEEIDTSRPLQLAIVGRPNTGKSTLVNHLLGEDRVLTGPEAGVTRDAIEIDWEWDGRPVRLVDTAGLRRKARVENSLEKLSVAETLNAIRMAQVVVLMLDANAVLEKQDLTIARMVIEEGRALVIAVNKWDAVDDRQASLKRLNDRLATSLPQVKGIPTVTISALKGKGMAQLRDAVFSIFEVWNARVSTGPLNRWLEEMTANHPPPLSKQGRRVKLRYMTQAKTRPPTFAIFTSRPDDLPDSYMRYLINGLRQDFGLEGIPLRLYLRKPKNPYA